MNKSIQELLVAGLSCCSSKSRRLLACIALTPFTAALTISSAARADDFGFIGGTQTVHTYGAHPAQDCLCGAGPGDGYTYDLSGSFTSASNWDDNNQPYNPVQGVFAPSAPGANDTVTIGGLPAGFLSPLMGPSMTLCEDTTSCLVTVPVYGNYDSGPGGVAGYTGGNGFSV
jgi:hypothetical protein